MNKLIGNRYLLAKKIGSGGMADVYLAMDTVLNREVAVKILRGSLAQDPVALLRFQREARAISGLSHTNVVEVYDVGEDDGQHYIVMEMVRGITLKELVHRRGALDIVEAVSIMKQLAGGINEAHTNQVIHRDIKPQNVLVKDDGTVKITDFGIALAEDAIQLTKQDSVMGSVHYMAPELSRGEGASFQSDIYALGIVFYELLTGDVPYRGENAVEIAMKHLRDPFPSVQRFNAKIPNSIENIISKSTQKNRNIRYNHIQQFIDDLDGCLDPKNINESLWEPVMDEADEEKTKMFARIEENVQPKKKGSKITLFGGVGILVLAMIVGAWFLLKPKQPEELKVPEVIGQSADIAVNTLETMGLYVSPSISYEYSDEYDKGIVIAIRPGEGAIVEPGEQVRLTVSLGLTFEIDDYSGLTLDAVRQLLSDQNIGIKVINEPKNDVAPGIVLRQEGLAKGDRINPSVRQEIILYVSSKMEVLIPSSIIGQPVAQAQAELIDMGVKVVTEVLSQAGMSPSEIEKLKYNVVIRSNPMPGSYYVQDESNSVTLYYYVQEHTTNPQEEEKQNPDDNEDGDNQ